MNYTIETIEDNIADLTELAKKHYVEAHQYPDIPLCVNWDRFITLEKAGILKTFICRKDEQIVGYALFFIITPIEYSTSLQGTLSNIFIHPDHRGTGGKFITWCEKQLKEMGCQVINHHVKAKNDYGVLLKRLGYSIMNIEYSKRLDK